MLRTKPGHPAKRVAAMCAIERRFETEELINTDHIDLGADYETGHRHIPEFSSIGHAIDIGFLS
jgi:hypothetical protein